MALALVRIQTHHQRMEQGGAPGWFKGVLALCALGVGFWWMRSSSVEKQVAEDAEAQYKIVRSSGGAVDRCVQAGLVAAAWLQAKDSDRYEQWKRTEINECRAAGVPK